MGVIEIRDLIFKYQDNLIFNKLNLSIKQGSFTTIIGNNGCGKSTLVKLLLGFKRSKGIYLFDKPLENNLWLARRKIGVVFENPASFFIENTVEKEIALSLKHLPLNTIDKQKKMLTIIKELKIEDILTENPMLLNKEKQCLVAFACCLAIDPEIIVIDDVLSMISTDIVLKLLKKINKKGVTIINLTTNEEELLYGNNVVFLGEEKNIFTGTKTKLLNHLEIFEKYKIELPFVIDLSNKLMFYDLINKRYTNMNVLVNNIWKN